MPRHEEKGFLACSRWRRSEKRVIRLAIIAEGGEKGGHCRSIRSFSERGGDEMPVISARKGRREGARIRAGLQRGRAEICKGAEKTSGGERVILLAFGRDSSERGREERTFGEEPA